MRKKNGCTLYPVSYTHLDVYKRQNPSYNGSYYRSEQTVKDDLAEYPGIQVVLDIHRDALGKDVYKRQGVDCVAAVSGIGKVNAAMCAQTMILRYHPRLIINTGVARCV